MNKFGPSGRAAFWPMIPACTAARSSGPRSSGSIRMKIFEELKPGLCGREQLLALIGSGHRPPMTETLEFDLVEAEGSATGQGCGPQGRGGHGLGAGPDQNHAAARSRGDAQGAPEGRNLPPAGPVGAGPAAAHNFLGPRQRRRFRHTAPVDQVGWPLRSTVTRLTPFHRGNEADHLSPHCSDRTKSTLRTLIEVPRSHDV